LFLPVIISSMKIKEILNTKRPVFSFEFFPPKDSAGFESLFQTIESLKSLAPAFVSVTYGAGGSSRNKTIDLVGRIKNDVGIEAMAHLTCVGHSRDEIGDVLKELEAKGIENVLALRGDPPQGQEKFVAHENGFKYANELTDFIKHNYSFCLGCAGYPEVHPESTSVASDIESLKRKVSAGADFIITQLFFNNDHYFEFVAKVRAAGITVPVIPGIMPILNLKQTIRFTEMCQAEIPADLMNKMEAVKDDGEAVKQIGIAHAAQQCRNLLDGGAPGIHFYTLNRSNATLAIMETLKSDFL
jgi:methylenetetrahydrofolate reductase (NADPH)